MVLGRERLPPLTNPRRAVGAEAIRVYTPKTRNHVLKSGVSLPSHRVTSTFRPVRFSLHSSKLLDSAVGGSRGRSPRSRVERLPDATNRGVGPRLRVRQLPERTRGLPLRPRPLPAIARGARLRLQRKPLPAPEATLREQPLRCAGSTGPIADAQGGRPWHKVLDDEHRRSFVSYRQDAFSASTLRQWFRDLHEKIEWDQPRVGARLLPRSAAWLTEGDCKCCYRYGGTSWPALPMDKWFLEITDAVCRACGVTERPNSCNANLYKDGSEMVGWHSDDEPLFDATSHDTLILSLSLGEAREFVVRPNDDPAETTSLRLGDGDICTMEGLHQKHYKHAVPKKRSAGRARINLTWRWVVAHDRGCPLHRERLPAPSRVGNVKPEIFTKRPSGEVETTGEPQVRRGLKRASTGPVETLNSDAPDSSMKVRNVEVSQEEQAKREARARRFARQTPAGAPVEPAPVSKPASSENAGPVGAALRRSPKRKAPESQEDKNREQKRLRAERFGLSSEPSASRGLGTQSTNPPSKTSIVSIGASKTGHGKDANPSEQELRRRRAERFLSPAPGSTAVGSAPTKGSAPVGSDPAQKEGGRDDNRGRDRSRSRDTRSRTSKAGPTNEELKRKRAERFASPAPGLKVANSKPISRSTGVKQEYQTSEAHAGAKSSALAGSSLGVAQLVVSKAEKPTSQMSEAEKKELRRKRFALG